MLLKEYVKLYKLVLKNEAKIEDMSKTCPKYPTIRRVTVARLVKKTASLVRRAKVIEEQLGIDESKGRWTIAYS
jgi:hypothetical protein